MSTANNTILLVEDEPNTQFVIKKTIENANLAVSVKVVNNGMEAVDYLLGKDFYADRKRYPLPVLILTDVDMPRLSGLDLLVWVKQQPELNDLPIVVMSGSEGKKQLTRAKDLGARAYFVKTSAFHDLIYLVQALLPWHMPYSLT